MTRPDGKNLVGDLKAMTHGIVQAIHLITAAAENMKEASGWVSAVPGLACMVLPAHVVIALIKTGQPRRSHRHCRE